MNCSMFHATPICAVRAAYISVCNFTSFINHYTPECCQLRLNNGLWWEAGGWVRWQLICHSLPSHRSEHPLLEQDRRTAIPEATSACMQMP